MDRVIKCLHFIKRGALRVLYYKFMYEIVHLIAPTKAYNYLILKHNAIIEYLNKIWINNGDDIPLPNQLLCNISDNTIWMFWWQGLDDIPELVSICIDSVRRMSSSWNVVLITKDNIDEYITLPENIKNKIGSTISYTHLSDIVRITLLAAYGGFWIDSTIFLTRRLDDKQIKSFFTVRNTPRQMLCVSEGRWSGNFMFAEKGNVLLAKMYSLIYAYWSNNNYLIDYFLIDYLIEYFYRKDKRCKKIIDEVKLSNPYMYGGLLNILKSENDLIENQNIKDLFKSTYVHKLSWKENIPPCKLKWLELIITELQDKE